jgi:integrase
MNQQFNNEVGSIRYYLKDKNSLDQTLLKGSYLFKNFNIGFTTGIKLTPNIEWNNQEKIVISGKNKRLFNDKLAKFKTSITESHKNFNEIYHRLPTKEELKGIDERALAGSGTQSVRKDKKNFDDVYNEVLNLILAKENNSLESQKIGNSSKGPHKSYISSIKIAYKDLKEFAVKESLILDIDTFNEQNILDFQNFLIKFKQLKPSTIKTRIKRIAMILKRAFDKGYTNQRVFLLDEFKVSVPPTTSTSLTENEIDIFYNFDLSTNKRLEKIRDLFVLACHTSLRFSDVTRIERNHINSEEKIINIISQKTSTSSKYKSLSLPFFGKVDEILQKYNCDIRQLSISNQKTNEYLKEIFELIPYFKNKILKEEKLINNKMQFIESDFIKTINFHTARRNFCTNRYCEGWELLEIWDYTGHTDERTFKTYFRPTVEHEKLRQKNIKDRNEKIKSFDKFKTEMDSLKKELQTFKDLNNKGDFKEMGKVIEINQKIS